ncbi:MAG TPA: hypothetical protein VFD30_19735 [Terriglobia bacterium]|nr:hypothetical protein [Terriglobia bacterium]
MSKRELGRVETLARVKAGELRLVDAALAGDRAVRAGRRPGAPGGEGLRSCRHGSDVWPSEAEVGAAG